MKNLVKKFCLRGLICGGFGPLVYALVMIILFWCNVDTISHGMMMFKAVFSTYLMAFVIAGASTIWEEERLGLPICILIHGTILYLCYIITYITNGWIQTDWVPLLVFSGVFVLGYLLIWFIIYVVEKNRAKRFNKGLKKNN